MKTCTVSMIGKDGETHLVEVEASSLFDAAGQAVQRWARFWWFQPDEAPAFVRSDGPSYLGAPIWSIQMTSPD